MPIAVVPLKAFRRGKERLSGALPAKDRVRLTRLTAVRVITACAEAGLTPLVVTGDGEVIATVRALGVETMPDPGHGLDGAASAGIAEAGAEGWCLVHGDLPLVTPADLLAASSSLQAGLPVIAPARDGGTNLICGRGPFPFSHGPASFHRHLAGAGPTAHILIRPGLTVEIDTPGDLAAAVRTEEGAWMEPFLR